MNASAVPAEAPSDLHTVTVPELEHFRSSLTQEAATGYALPRSRSGRFHLPAAQGGRPSAPTFLPDELKAWPIHAMNC
ncbi:MAG: hypothetical protein ACLSUW_02780 [Akkermansia sp.]